LSDSHTVLPADRPLIARAKYILISVIFIAVAASVLLLGTDWLLTAVSNIIFGSGKGNSYAMHLLQACYVLLFMAALVNIWCCFINNRAISIGQRWSAE